MQPIPARQPAQHFGSGSSRLGSYLGRGRSCWRWYQYHNCSSVAYASMSSFSVFGRATGLCRGVSGALHLRGGLLAMAAHTHDAHTNICTHTHTRTHTHTHTRTRTHYHTHSRTRTRTHTRTHTRTRTHYHTHTRARALITTSHNLNSPPNATQARV